MKHITSNSKLMIAALAVLALGNYTFAESPIVEGRSGGDATKVIASPSPAAMVKDNTGEEAVVVSGGRGTSSATEDVEEVAEEANEMSAEEKMKKAASDKAKETADKAKKSVTDGADKMMGTEKKVEGTTNSPNRGATSIAE